MHYLRTQKIAVVGQGYVGLPLSLQFCRVGLNVLGLDIDPKKVAALNKGQSYIKHIPGDQVAAARALETRASCSRKPSSDATRAAGDVARSAERWRFRCRGGSLASGDSTRLETGTAGASRATSGIVGTAGRSGGSSR